MGKKRERMKALDCIEGTSETGVAEDTNKEVDGDRTGTGDERVTVQ